MALKGKQQRFVDEYLIDLNASKAALRAGYSPKTAPFIGYENLKKPQIQKEIQKCKELRSRRTKITQDRVLQEYTRIAFCDPRLFYNDDGSLKKITELSADQAACVAGLDSVSSTNKDGTTENVKKIKIADKLKALQDVAKHLNMFIERREITGADGNPIKTSIQIEFVDADED